MALETPKDIQGTATEDLRAVEGHRARGEGRATEQDLRAHVQERGL